MSTQNSTFTIEDEKNFTVSGKIRKGWVIAEPDALSDDEILLEWLNKARNFVETLPPR